MTTSTHITALVITALLLGCVDVAISGFGETGSETGDIGDDGRRDIVLVECALGQCAGLWSDSNAWSDLVMVSTLESMPGVDPATIWNCEPDPDVDLCVVVDALGHQGCFRYEQGFAVAVAPACAGVEGWLDVGNGMVSNISDLEGAHNMN